MPIEERGSTFSPARCAPAGLEAISGADHGPDQLHRSMSVWNTLILGFAVVSPVVGLYAIIGVQTVVTGGGWFGALMICLVMQLLVAIEPSL